MRRRGWAAIQRAEALDKTDEIGLISSLPKSRDFWGLLRNKVLFAPTDKMVEQGRLSVKQAVKLSTRPTLRDAQCKNWSSDPCNTQSQIIADSLSPSPFRPVFSTDQNIY